jgi:hypothetical protein
MRHTGAELDRVAVRRSIDRTRCRAGASYRNESLVDEPSSFCKCHAPAAYRVAIDEITLQIGQKARVARRRLKSRGDARPTGKRK